ncbi:MAG: histidine kinase, partial [Haliea sp.]
RMLLAGALLGMSVVVMHYLGMYGMKFGGYIQWDYAVVAASIAIAVVAATAALWLAFHTAALLRRVWAALVMAVAVCAMHYTGMAAAEFICTTANRNAIPQGFGYVSSFSISSMVVIAGLSMAFLIAMSLLFQPGSDASNRALNAAKPSRG